MEKDLKQQLLTRLDWVARLALAGLFLYAAYPKLADPEAFARAITNYRVSLPMIGQGYVYLAAGFLPALEAVAAVSLVFTRTKQASSLILSCLLALFAVLILQAVLRGLNIDCGCFGSSALAQAKANQVGWTKIGHNVAWLAVSLFVYIRSRTERPASRKPLPTT